MSNTAGVAPAILKLRPTLDQGQQEIIGHLEGPVRGIAGPGAGKTLVVALRGANLLLQGQARPEELILCTYNRAAARELQRRFVTLASAAGCREDLERVRIGTIHGLCNRILRRHPRRVGLGRGYRLLNEEDQRRLMLERFDDIFGPGRGDLERRGWRRPHAVVNNARRYFDRIADEVIDPGDLIDDGGDFLAALGRCYHRYLRLLRDRNLADFAHLQVWVDELVDHDRIAADISGAVRHLMCDEYQDTSYVQERVLRRLAEGHGNIWVVGDDDQNLYRFRGASVRNILEFPVRYPDCRTVELTVNYRSHPAIVGFYDRWMAVAMD